MASDKQLRAEVEALRAEVAELRKQQATHYCISPQTAWQQPWANACAGGVGHVYTVDVSKPLNINFGPTFGAAGCAGANVATYMVPLGN